MNRIQKAIAILEKTNNGSNLAPRHLNLVQLVVNKHASDYGLEAFDKLYEQIIKGTYDKSKIYFYNVEHMTKDSVGYIYYKGQQIGHFSYDDREEERIATFRAAKRCRLLEKKGHPIDPLTYCWQVEKYLTPEEIAACENVDDEMAQCETI